MTAGPVIGGIVVSLLCGLCVGCGYGAKHHHDRYLAAAARREALEAAAAGAGNHRDTLHMTRPIRLDSAGSGQNFQDTAPRPTPPMTYSKNKESGSKKKKMEARQRSEEDGEIGEAAETTRQMDRERGRTRRREGAHTGATTTAATTTASASAGANGNASATARRASDNISGANTNNDRAPYANSRTTNRRSTGAAVEAPAPPVPGRAQTPIPMLGMGLGFAVDDRAPLPSRAAAGGPAGGSTTASRPWRPGLLTETTTPSHRRRHRPALSRGSTGAGSEISASRDATPPPPYSAVFPAAPSPGGVQPAGAAAAAAVRAALVGGAVGGGVRGSFPDGRPSGSGSGSGAGAAVVVVVAEGRDDDNATAATAAAASSSAPSGSPGVAGERIQRRMTNLMRDLEQCANAVDTWVQTTRGEADGMAARTAGRRRRRGTASGRSKSGSGAGGAGGGGRKARRRHTSRFGGCRTGFGGLGLGLLPHSEGEEDTGATSATDVGSAGASIAVSETGSLDGGSRASGLGSEVGAAHGVGLGPGEHSYRTEKETQREDAERRAAVAWGWGEDGSRREEAKESQAHAAAMSWARIGRFVPGREEGLGRGEVGSTPGGGDGASRTARGSRGKRGGGDSYAGANADGAETAMPTTPGKVLTKFPSPPYLQLLPSSMPRDAESGGRGGSAGFSPNSGDRLGIPGPPFPGPVRTRGWDIITPSTRGRNPNIAVHSDDGFEQVDLTSPGQSQAHLLPQGISETSPSHRWMTSSPASPYGGRIISILPHAPDTATGLRFVEDELLLVDGHSSPSSAALSPSSGGIQKLDTSATAVIVLGTPTSPTSPNVSRGHNRSSFRHIRTSTKKGGGDHGAAGGDGSSVYGDVRVEERPITPSSSEDETGYHEFEMGGKPSGGLSPVPRPQQLQRHWSENKNEDEGEEEGGVGGIKQVGGGGGNGSMDGDVDSDGDEENDEGDGGGVDGNGLDRDFKGEGENTRQNTSKRIFRGVSDFGTGGGSDKCQRVEMC